MKKFVSIAALIFLLAGCQTVDDFIGEGPITLSNDVSGHYQNKYLKGVGPQNYIVSKDGRYSHYVYCAAGPGQCTFGLVVLDAITKCEKRSGQKCYIFAEGDEVVWKGPVSFGQGGGSFQGIDKGLIKLSDASLCYLSVDHRVKSPSWTTILEYKDYVSIAKSRSLTPAGCATNGLPESDDVFVQGLNTDDLCRLSRQGSPHHSSWSPIHLPRFWAYIGEAKDRGLEPYECYQRIQNAS